MVAIDPFAIEEGAQIQPRNKTLRCFYRKPTPKLSTLHRPSFRHILFFFVILVVIVPAVNLQGPVM